MPSVPDDPGFRTGTGTELPFGQTGPTGGEVFGAAFRQANAVVSTIHAMRNSGLFAPEDGYNPLDEIKGSKYYDEHAHLFLGSRSRGETASIKHQIDLEDADRRTLDAGGTMGVVGQMVAGLVDPTMALPAGIAIKGAREGWTFAKSARNLAIAGAVTTARQEAVLQATQQTRPLEESLLNIGSATLLSAFLGGAAMKLMGPAERAAATAELERVRGEMDAHTSGEPALTPANQNAPSDIASAPLAAAAGAAASDVRQLELVPSGLERIPVLGRLLRISNPMTRMMSSAATSARRAFADLAELPLRTKENVEGLPTVSGGGPSIERLARLAINQGRIGVGDRLTELWQDLRFNGEKAPWFARTRDAIGMIDRPDGAMTFEQFKEQVSLALTQGDKHEIPQVAQGAKFVRDTVFEPWKERAIGAKLFPEDVDVKTAESYFQRVWNKQALAANRPEAVNRFTDWLKGDQEQKAKIKDRLEFYRDQLGQFGDRQGKLEAMLDRLDTRMTELGGRLDEKGMEVARAEKREGVVQERATSLAEDMSEIDQFVADMRQQVTDPALRARLDQMAKEAAELRAADKPMTEAQLRQVEEQELKGILTGPTRMAAEMLVGRRKYPKAPSFITWLVANGGVRDEGGDVAAVIGGPRARPGLINNRTGLSVDQIGERIADQFGAHFPERDVPGGGRPEPAQILDWVNDAMRGQEPGWWVESLSDADRQTIEASHIARGLDRVLREAGVEVKKVSDVAKFLRDGQRGNVTLADLDRIAGELEAAGQEIPVAARRGAVEEEHAATVEDIRAAKGAIEKARREYDSRERLYGKATAREEEAGLAGRAARGRLGVLEDRMARAEARRELLADAAAVAERQSEEVRGKVEDLIGRWEGDSSAEAKSALKAREAYEATRTEPGPRLRPADKAVDRAVNLIIESHRDLSDAELRDIGHEIIQRILASPDGRLPYDLSQGGPEVGWGKAGFSEPPRGPLARRNFNIPDRMIWDYLEHDVEHVVAQHLRTMVPDVMLTERFGDTRMTEAFRKIDNEYAGLIDSTKNQADRLKLEKGRQSDLSDLADVRDRVRGVFGFPTYNQMPGAARIAASVKNANVITSMGMAMWASIPDMAGPVFRFGMGTVFRDAYNPMLKSLMTGGELNREAMRQFRAMGIAIESTLAARHHSLVDAMDGLRPQSRFERTLQWGADRFQLLNMLGPWTDFGKLTSSLVASQELFRASDALAKGTATARQIAILGENNITPSLAAKIAEQYAATGDKIDGVHLPNTERWTDAEARRAFEGAVSRETDIAIVSPGQEKPLLMSNPVLGLLFQFKSFTAAATQRILIANLQRHDAQVLQGLVFSLGLGMLSYKVNSMLGGQPTSDRPQDWIKEAMSRGNIFGWLEEGNALTSKMTRGRVDMYRMLGSNKPLSRYAGRSVMDQMLGPTAGKVESLAQITGAAAARDWGESDTKAVRRLTAMQNLFWLRGILNQVEHGANNAFGIPMKQQ